MYALWMMSSYTHCKIIKLWTWYYFFFNSLLHTFLPFCFPSQFWRRSGFSPVYLRQTPNELTGEHSCIMLRTLETARGDAWLPKFFADFSKRFLSLLSYQFRTFSPKLALMILQQVWKRSHKFRYVEKYQHTQIDRVYLLLSTTHLDSRFMCYTDIYWTTRLDTRAKTVRLALLILGIIRSSMPLALSQTYP